MNTPLALQPWPVDPGGKDAFYGRPQSANDHVWQAANLVPYVVPWSGRTVMVHRLVRASLDRVLTRYWTEINHDQTVISKYGMGDVETYNYRPNRNNTSSLSNHSYGIAVDIAPSLNPNGSHWVDGGRMLPRRLIELFKFEGWRWGGDFGTTSSGAEHGTKDPMHFEAVYSEHGDQQPVPAPKAINDNIAQPATGVAPSAGGAAGFPLNLGAGGDFLGLAVRSLALAELKNLGQKLKDHGDMLITYADAAAKGAPVPSGAAGLTQLLDPLGLLGSAGKIAPAASPANPLDGLPDFLKLRTAAAGAAVPGPAVQKAIIGTWFGGPNDRNESAYDEKLITLTEPGCALPYHFPRPLPTIAARGPNGAVISGIPIRDVGPVSRAWPSKTGDLYWRTGSRPAAETKKILSRAGIDFTMKTFVDLGGDPRAGKMTVDWWFDSGNEPAVATQGTSTMSMPDAHPSQDAQVGAPVVNPFTSKVNWVGALTILVPLITAKVGPALGLSAADIMNLLVYLILPICGGLAIYFRTWLTNKLLPQSLPTSARKELGV